MQMYSMVKIEKLKLYEPSLIMEIEEVGHVAIVDDFSPKYLDKILEDIIIDNMTRNSRWEDVEYLRIDFKGKHPS